MKRVTFLKGLAITFALSCITTLTWAQASPAATATGTVKGANLTIRYSSPSVKGRQI